MNWLLERAVRYLLGSAAVDGITDEMMDSITLAVREEGERMGLTEPSGA